MSKDIGTYRDSKIQWSWILRNICAERSSRLALLIIVLFYLVAIAKPLLIGPYPILFSDDKGLHFGYFLQDYTIQSMHWKIDYLFSYTSYSLDLSQASLKPPFYGSEEQATHWLGTDILGRDVLSGICNGAAIAAKVGTLSMLISFIVGLGFGSVAGYYGDRALRFSRVSLIVSVGLILFSVYFFYYSISFSLYQYELNAGWVLITISIFFNLLASRISTDTYSIAIPLDSILLRILEFYKAIPTLIIILVLLAAIPYRSIWVIILIISFFKWTQVARYARAEMLRIKAQSFMNTAASLGINHMRIIMLHALPNILPAIIVVMAFGISSAILLESTLSFLGLGLDVEEVSWGSMLAEARRNFSAWWLAVFPGFAIFCIVASFNIIGERLNILFNPLQEEPS